MFLSFKRLLCYLVKRLNLNIRNLIVVTYLTSLIVSPVSCSNLREKVVWAVNSGGDMHTDIHGITYQADRIKVGVESDYGKSLMIQRVVPQDQVLYQTERYHLSTFGYEVPLKEDGDYVIVLKFCEVWFTAPGQKVFDVVLNGEHTIVDELDIFAKVGRGVAHDEIISFTIKNGKLKVNGETSQLDEKLTLEFIKGDLDNPKINAIYILNGTPDDIPKLPPLQGQETPSESFDDEDEELDDSGDKTKSFRKHNPSGPRAVDPYASDDTSTMLLPVFIAVGAFIPLLFCLCKL